MASFWAQPRGPLGPSAGPAPHHALGPPGAQPYAQGQPQQGYAGQPGLPPGPMPPAHQRPPAPAPPPPPPHEGDSGRLHSVDELPPCFRSVFSFRYFNAIQNECWPAIFEGGPNVVVAAPTGGGARGEGRSCTCRC